MELKIFSGTSNEPLAEEIANHISARNGLGKMDEKRRHPDGEVYARYAENIRDCDAFIIQSTNPPAEFSKELAIMIHTAVLASARRITAVVPYFGYARQDRKDKSRAPVSVIPEVRDIISNGAHRLLILDPHSSAIEVAAGAWNTPCDRLTSLPVFVDYIRSSPEFKDFIKKLVVAAPDLNAGNLARDYAQAFGAGPIAVIEKRRDPDSGQTDIHNVIGDVRGKNVLIADDMIDTGGTECNAAQAFKERGANEIFALATHGLFTEPALERIAESSISKVFVTNSIVQRNLPDFVHIVSVAKLLGEAIMRIHTGDSVSSLLQV